MRKYVLAALLMASCLAMPANATIIYDNGGPDALSGNETTQWIQAEDFSFGGATNVGGAGVYLTDVSGISSWDGSFTYYLFADSGGTPGALLDSGGVSPTVSNAGVACCGGSSLLFEFDFLSPFGAAAGSTYWLGIHASTNFDRDELYWSSTGANGSATGQESFGGTLDNWNGNGQEHAFYLTDGVGAVPEPGTWAMMMLGFGMAGAAVRRGKRRSGTARTALA